MLPIGRQQHESSGMVAGSPSGISAGGARCGPAPPRRAGTGRMPLLAELGEPCRSAACRISPQGRSTSARLPWAMSRETSASAAGLRSRCLCSAPDTVAGPFTRRGVLCPAGRDARRPVSRTGGPGWAPFQPRGARRPPRRASAAAGQDGVRRRDVADARRRFATCRWPSRHRRPGRLPAPRAVHVRPGHWLRPWLTGSGTDDATPARVFGNPHLQRGGRQAEDSNRPAAAADIKGSIHGSRAADHY